MAQEFVSIKGKRIEVKDNALNLSDMGIQDITEIEGLAALTNLEKLDLEKNSIMKIKGLDALINLKELDLEGNQITEIKGLESLIKLEKLDLEENQSRLWL